jgi:exopolyphosphatase
MEQAVRSAQTKTQKYSVLLIALHHVDLDSLASALGYAWLRSQTDGKAIAYITNPREDFYLREENLYALHWAGLSEPFEELYCSRETMPRQASQFGLVDHNIPEPTYASQTSTVVAIIDHHKDEGQYIHAKPRIIETEAGSCASLVTRMFKPLNLVMPAGLATLLLGAILIDTKGLKEGKASDIDNESAAFLLPLSLLTQGEQVTPPSDVKHLPSVQSLFATLDKKKSDVSDLSTKEFLRRDYKEYALNVPACLRRTQSSQIMTLAGLGTVPVRLSNLFASSKSPVEDIEGWFTNRNLSILGVLTSYRNKKDKKRREQLWVVRATDEDLAQRLWQGLESNKELELKQLRLRDVAAGKPDFGKKYVVRAYKVGNTDMSRKYTAPILRKILEGK